MGAPGSSLISEVFTSMSLRGAVSGVSAGSDVAISSLTKLEINAERLLRRTFAPILACSSQ